MFFQWHSMGCFTEIWIWMDLLLCVLMWVDTTAWNSISSSICFEIPQLEPMSKKVSLLPPELFIDLLRQWNVVQMGDSHLNGESVSSQTWPEFQNWGLWRVQNSSAVKELGSASVNKRGHTHRLHSYSAVNESNTFSFCHVLYQAPGSKDGQIQALPSKNSKSVEAKTSKQIIRWNVTEICIKLGAIGESVTKVSQNLMKR